MIGILVILLISWGLLYLFEKKGLRSLGWLPVSLRLKQFSIGFIFSAVLCIILQSIDAWVKTAEWTLNKDFTFIQILKSFKWDIQSVLTEELIFRGALLYLLTHKIGARKSILITATAFGIYHWFSYGALGNPMAMFFIFIGTGLMGWAWATAFVKTQSMLLPIGLHLGWNFTFNTIFSKGPLGDSFLILTNETPLTDWVSLFNFLSHLLVPPVLVLLFVKHLVKKYPPKNLELQGNINQL